MMKVNIGKSQPGFFEGASETTASFKPIFISSIRATKLPDKVSGQLHVFTVCNNSLLLAIL